MGAVKPVVAPPSRRVALMGVAAVLCASTARAAPAARRAPPVVTILGDSITAGLGLAAADALPAQLQAALARRGVDAVVRGAGVSGDTTGGALARTDFSVQADTAVCIVELGANDVFQSITPSQTEHNLREIIAKMQRRRVAVVLAGGRLPARSTGSYGREFAAVFSRLGRLSGVTLAPDSLDAVRSEPGLRQADGVHPNARGARAVAERLAPAVAAALHRLGRTGAFGRSGP